MSCVGWSCDDSQEKNRSTRTHGVAVQCTSEGCWHELAKKQAKSKRGSDPRTAGRGLKDTSQD